MKRILFITLYIYGIHDCSQIKPNNKNIRNAYKLIYIKRSFKKYADFLNREKYLMTQKIQNHIHEHQKVFFTHYFLKRMVALKFLTLFLLLGIDIFKMTPSQTRPIWLNVLYCFCSARLLMVVMVTSFLSIKIWR